jgi:predicted permease
MDRDNHMLQAVGRLAPSTTVAEARLDMQRIAAELAAEHPEANAGWSATVSLFSEWRVGDRLERIGAFLMLAVGLLLLMACGSVSTMLIARATGRQKEMGLRAALGAGRRRIVGQLITESAVLGLLGGGLGVLLAWLGTPAVRALGPGDMARLGEASIDGRVLGVALATSVLSVLVFGLAPALFATRGRLFDALREGAPSVPGGHRRLRDALVVAQFALAIVVVLGAGLMTRSFAQVQAVELGFRPQGALQFSVGLPDGAFTMAERVTFLDQLSAQISGLPGVEAVGLTMSAPFSPFQASNFVAPADDLPDRQDDFVPVSWRAVDGGFFEAAGVQLIAGRIFSGADVPPEDEQAMANGYEMSVIIDESLAREMWGTPNGLGQAIVWGDPAGPTMRVVGVVSSIRDEWVQDEPRPRIYLPYAVFPWPSPVVVVRSANDPTALVPTIRTLVQRLDADVPVMDVASLPELTRQAVAWPRFTMQVVSAFGLVAVILAAMGIYGVASFGVLRRRREIGIRVALGAEPGRIVGLVLRGAVRLALVGIVLGVVLAFAMSDFLDSLLYGIEPNDAMTFTILPVGLGLIAVLASWLPARRATRVDPREALTQE